MGRLQRVSFPNVFPSLVFLGVVTKCDVQLVITEGIEPTETKNNLMLCHNEK
jgi:hypothetical protein